MREIKFRAFVDGEMIDADSLAFEYFEPLKDQLASCEYLMQYTGLKDKNGVEIYEGDIVTGSYNNLDVDYSESSQVVWGYAHDSDGWANEVTVGWVTGNGSSLQDLVSYEGCEIIGNIHEHKHLLEPQEEK